MESKWIEWSAGDMPVASETLVDVRHADGTVSQSVTAGDCRDDDPKWGYDWWRHIDTPDHADGFIVGYKVLEQ